MWRVAGIKIESAAFRQKTVRVDRQICEKLKIFTLRPPTLKRRELLGWAIQGVKPVIHRGTNAFYLWPIRFPIPCSGWPQYKMNDLLWPPVSLEITINISAPEKTCLLLNVSILSGEGSSKSSKWLHVTSKSSQELRMLSRSLSDCQSTISIAVSLVIVVSVY